MDSLATQAVATQRISPPEPQADYYTRARALWPRLEPMRPGNQRRDANRVAALVSRRTTLPVESILTLLGAPAQACEDRVA